MDDKTKKSDLDRCGWLTSCWDTIERVDEMRESPETRDFTIHCGVREFKVHSELLSLRSKYFSRMFHHPYLETLSNKIEFPDDDPDAIADMVDYMYSTSFYRMQIDQSFAAFIHRSAQLFIIADKYEVKSLRSTVLEAFEWALKARPPKDWSATELRQLINMVYDSTIQGSELRPILVNALGNPLFDKLLDGMREGLYESPDFLYELMLSMRSHRLGPHAMVFFNDYPYLSF
ncbi:hypothetical protein DBV05_g5804 [Lasiodiplodia theobromae]|uniref:BTB domain-containing protein n=1 Tax=Lasiodiplodia theobromae TaxID=45133 RepID=A0A5N5DD05_9PEZI|nr:hypothetical protein DBV05_g5804 [Lasiodiplodia theobromae]